MVVSHRAGRRSPVRRPGPEPIPQDPVIKSGDGAYEDLLRRLGNWLRNYPAVVQVSEIDNGYMVRMDGRVKPQKLTLERPHD
jgi:hypothetical protein